jgi:hypothetical protein
LSGPRQRAIVGGYLRRFDGWTRLREAFARALGISTSDILDLEAQGDPVVFLEARTQHGDFALRMQAYIDEARAPGFTGKTALVRALARDLGVDALYDDGGSPVPVRWVLVRPDGSCYEVFERADASGDELVLDATIPARSLEPQTTHD